MDKICDLKNTEDLIKWINRAKEHLSPDFLLVLLGPTASGKTHLAVQLAEAVNGEIISADSRQVYRRLDIGTGKDLEEYGDIPYHLIDNCNPEDSYSVKEFKQDFLAAYQNIKQKGRQAILCGGSGSYIQSILQEQPYSHVPTNPVFRDLWGHRSKEELLSQLAKETIPADFSIDTDNHKRLLRALEILAYLRNNSLPSPAEAIVKDYLILGLQPSVIRRRERIDRRLEQRLSDGLITEVEGLLASGLSHEQLQWFGLEYKYASLYLLGDLSYPAFETKLRTEIHRFAKRQMTYFRKMEKDGIQIHWLSSDFGE